MEQSQGKISVIIPIYKVEKYIDQCVQSIVNQTYSDLEIILVDDGSPDNCPKLCDKWAENDERIVVIHQENSGVSCARNKGLEIAQGEYVSFVDGDDWIRPDMYEILINSLNENKADICACGIINAYNEKEKRIPAIIISGKPNEIFSLVYDDTKFLVSPWNKLYRKEIWNHVRFPKGITHGEDALAVFEAIHQSHYIVQIPDSLYYYRIRENSAMTETFNSNRMSEEVVWYKNYQFMLENYPELSKKAYDYYLLKVNVMIREMSLEDRESYKKEYIYLRNIIKENLAYLMFKSAISLKQKIRLLLDYLSK